MKIFTIDLAAAREALNSKSHLIDKSGDCWIWRGLLNTRGYGVLCFKSVRYYTHRLSYAIHHGRDTFGLLMHSCDEPKCLNPNHLSEGSYAENSRDMVLKGRSARGSRAGRAKLTEDDVLRIRSMLEAGVTQVELASQFGVKPAALSRIARRETWAHI